MTHKLALSNLVRYCITAAAVGPTHLLHHVLCVCASFFFSLLFIAPVSTPDGNKNSGEKATVEELE